MSKTNRNLMALLLVQLGIVGFTWHSRRVVEIEARNLLDIKAEDVLEVIISRMPGKLKTDDGESIRMTRDGDRWVLPDAENFPLDTGKVNDMLGRLALAKIRRPVATKKENHNALQVGKLKYEKRIEIKTKTSQYALYAGNAKGQSMHARFAEQVEVYLARGVQAWNLSHQIESYADTDYVKVDDPTEIRIHNQNGPIDSQQNEDGTWTVAQLPSDKPVDFSRVRSLVRAAQQIKLNVPAGRKIKPEYGLGKNARATVFLKGPAGSANYEIGAESGGYVYIKAEGQDYVAKIHKFNASAVLKTRVDDLIDTTKLQKGSPPNGWPLKREDWPKDIPKGK